MEHGGGVSALHAAVFVKCRAGSHRSLIVLYFFYPSGKFPTALVAPVPVGSLSKGLFFNLSIR